MAMSLRGRTRNNTREVQNPLRSKENERKLGSDTEEPIIVSVSVVYYLSKNGQLEHPHFMEITLRATSEGLFLRDVINRMNTLRGKGVASMYSWSSKRSYRGGYVWHDLSEHDLIHPTHGHEYVLKGSELLLHHPHEETYLDDKSHESASSSSKLTASAARKSDDDFRAPANRRKNQSWSSIDLHEYNVYKTDLTNESVGKSATAAADAATQTEDKRRRRKTVESGSEIVELSREEISPPPSDSSPETLESLMKADGRLVLFPAVYHSDDQNNRTAGNFPSGRIRASTVIKQLISCGAVSFKNCGTMGMKDQGLSLVSQHKDKMLREAVDRKEEENELSLGRLNLEDKKYFSGSLIEREKYEIVSLKRSSSYNPER